MIAVFLLHKIPPYLRVGIDLAVHGVSVDVPSSDAGSTLHESYQMEEIGRCQSFVDFHDNAVVICIVLMADQNPEDVYIVLVPYINNQISIVQN